MSRVTWTQFVDGDQSGETTVAGSFDTFEEARVFLNGKRVSAEAHGYSITMLTDLSFKAEKGNTARIFVVEE